MLMLMRKPVLPHAPVSRVCALSMVSIAMNIGQTLLSDHKTKKELHLPPPPSPGMMPPPPPPPPPLAPPTPPPSPAQTYSTGTADDDEEEEIIHFPNDEGSM